MKKIKISWSAYDRWRKCPLQYKLYYIDEKGFDIDDEQDRYYAVTGSVLQEVFTRFYNDQLWRLRSKTVSHLTKKVLPEVWNFTLERIFVDWNKHKKTKEEMYNEIEELIPKIVKFLIQEKLIDPKGLQRSEVKILTQIDIEDNIYLLGKFDFLFIIDDEIFILDGKATHNVNSDQLYFYCILYQRIYGKLPDKLGFLYYETLEVEYINIDPNSIQNLEYQISEMVKNIKEISFENNPSVENCQNCLLNSLCEYSQEVKEK